jgi:hypothetical protein
MNMLISGGWLILAFAIGIYVGITLLAALVVSSREPEQTDAEQLRDDPIMALIAAAWRADAASAPNPAEARHEGT